VEARFDACTWVVKPPLRSISTRGCCTISDCESVCHPLQLNTVIINSRPACNVTFAVADISVLFLGIIQLLVYSFV
jgi:hypothetical protein